MTTRSAVPSVVVDTDVVSYLFRGDTRAEGYRPHLDGRLLVLSFMTVAELSRWTLERNWGEVRRSALRTFLRQFVVRPYDPDICDVWAHVSVMCRRAGKPIQHADAWIAATALLHGVPLVTHNPADYAGVNNLTVLAHD